MTEIIFRKIVIGIHFLRSPIRLHGEGGVYDLYYSQPPGGAIKELAASLLRTSETHPILSVKKNHKVITIKHWGNSLIAI